MRILLTNNSLKELTGSEIDTAEIANYFADNGHIVDVFTLEAGLPLTSTINSKVNIIDFNTNKLLFNHYDLIWAHHFPLLDYLLFDRKITADYIHYVCLSTVEPLEFPPVYYKELSLLSTLSENGKLKLKTEGIDTSEVVVFPNYAQKRYFEYKKQDNQKLSSIAIVSNHIPEELLGAIDLLKKNIDIVDIYGKGYKYTRIDENVLSKYDVIISIGKTINYAIALGIPCYCYDRWGGPGYINVDNINNNLKDGFNGKTTPFKKSSEEIAGEIINSYNVILNQKEVLKKFAYENFCMENNIKKIIDELNLMKKIDYTNLYQKYENKKKTGGLFVNTVAQKNNEYRANVPDIISCCKLYLDNGDGFNATDVIIKYYNKNKDGSYDAEFDLHMIHSVKRLRIDFLDKMLVKVEYLKINDKDIQLLECNDMLKVNESIVTASDDPWMLIDFDSLQDKKLKVTIKLGEVPIIPVQDILINYIDCASKLSNLINSTSWKITEPLRKLKKLFKRT